MVLAPRPHHATFTPAQVARFCFRPCRDDMGETVPEYFRCRCGTVWKQTRRNSYTNLVQHVRREHPDYEAVMQAAPTAETGSMLSYVRRSAQIVYGWLDWIVKNNRPLYFCENQAARRSHKDCGAPHHRRDAHHIWAHLRRLEPRVGALYRRLRLLRGGLRDEDTPPVYSPLLDTLDEDLSARGHYEFLADMLPRDFGKQITGCLFLVDDNCAVNRLLATRMGVPLMGCARHQLNRAVQADMQQHEEDLATVQALMVRLRTLKQSAKLRQNTTLRPVIRHDTRWSSTFLMVHRYFRLLKHIDATDNAVVDVLPSPASNKPFRALLNDLKKIESVPKALQADNVSLRDVRVWFDGLIAIKPHYATYLGPRANIVPSPDFESVCVRVLEGKAIRLTRGEKSALRPFHCEDASDQAAGQTAKSGDEGSFIEQLLKRRRLASVAPRYELLGSIPPTPNIAERFFCVARTTYGQERHSLQPITLEMLLFLRQNEQYWSARIVDKATR